MIRHILNRALLLGLVVSLTPLVAVPVTAGEDEPFITIVGGGWGHGVGMSQYGALGRAEDGDSAIEILEFYYHDTEVLDLTGDPRLVDDMRVRLSPPYNGTRPNAATVSAEGGALVDVEIGATRFEDLAGPVSVTYQDSVWIVSDNGGGDLCGGACDGEWATVERPDGAVISVSDPLHGDHARHDTGNVRIKPDLSGVMVILVDVPMDEYLQGIAEVPSSWPTAAVEAQTIAARSYAAAKAVERRNASLSFDVYNSVQDQVYGGLDKESAAQTASVLATSGQVVVYDEAIVRTFYTSSNGGYTAASEDSFVTPEPFHIAKPDPYDPAYDEDGDPQNPYWRWERNYTVDQLSAWLASYPHADMDVGTVESISITELPPSGRVDDALVTIVGSDRTLEVRDSDDDPYGFRFYWALVLGCQAEEDCLVPRSTNFSITTFFDISLDDYFFEPVIWMAENEITTGTGPNAFSPNDPVTRAQVAAFLWRWADRPDGTLPTPFGDVESPSYYDVAVAWMVERAITLGMTEDTFAPDLVITRAQAATFLWRFAGRPDATPSDKFTDVPSWEYYTIPVAWMVEHEITTGETATTFAPDAPLTRGQIATFIWRLAGKPEAFHPDIELPSAMRS